MEKLLTPNVTGNIYARSLDTVTVLLFLWINKNSATRHSWLLLQFEHSWRQVTSHEMVCRHSPAERFVVRRKIGGQFYILR